MDYMIFYWFLPLFALLVIYSVVTEIQHKRRERRIAQCKKDLMDWLLFVGVMMDSNWKNPNGYPKDVTKEWLATITATYFKEFKDKRLK
jgi:hypothetical protein